MALMCPSRQSEFSPFLSSFDFITLAPAPSLIGGKKSPWILAEGVRKLHGFSAYSRQVFAQLPDKLINDSPGFWK